MFGYVLPAKDRLSEDERQRFRAVYCGLCHTLGKRYGFVARFTLNYDFTLLAILLSDAQGGESRCCRCAAHPCRGCAALDETPALVRAADKSLILAWWQLQDHIADHGFFKGLKYRLAALLLRRPCRRARRADPVFDAVVREKLGELAEAERTHCASIDRAAEPFAALLSAIADEETDARRARVLQQIFYHLGRWIYLVDAADDFEEDARTRDYNPLRFRYGTQTLGEEEKLALSQTLDASVRAMSAAYALWDFGVWTPILDSIFYDSLYRIGSAVLRGTYHAPPRLHTCSGKPKKEDTV